MDRTPRKLSDVSHRILHYTYVHIPFDLRLTIRTLYTPEKHPPTNTNELTIEQQTLYCVHVRPYMFVFALVSGLWEICTRAECGHAAGPAKLCRAI